MAVIFVFSAQPHLPKHPNSLADAALKKAAHLAEYAVLALLTSRAIRAAHPSVSSFVGAFLLSVGFAVTDELHQAFVPGRTSAAGDVLIDAAAAAATLLLVWAHRRPRAAFKDGS